MNSSMRRAADSCGTTGAGVTEPTGRIPFFETREGGRGLLGFIHHAASRVSDTSDQVSTPDHH
jgi:hypothetical protein